jgi:hypothetical protein
VGGMVYWLARKKRAERLAGAGNWERSFEDPRNSIKDAAGNYDIDGVSFDNKGVIVGSEPHHVTSPKHPRPEEMH